MYTIFNYFYLVLVRVWNGKQYLQGTAGPKKPGHYWSKWLTPKKSADQRVTSPHSLFIHALPVEIASRAIKLACKWCVRCTKRRFGSVKENAKFIWNVESLIHLLTQIIILNKSKHRVLSLPTILCHISYLKFVFGNLLIKYEKQRNQMLWQIFFS